MRTALRKPNPPKARGRVAASLADESHCSGCTPRIVLKQRHNPRSCLSANLCTISGLTTRKRNVARAFVQCSKRAHADCTSESIPRSVQDISESGDDDTDSVIDALQRDLEEDENLVDTSGDSRDGSRAPPRRRRLVLVQGSQVEEVETVPHEEGSIMGTSDEGVFVDREPDIVMPEVRENSAGIREGLRRLDAENLTTIFETRANVLKTVPHFLKGPYRSAMGMALSEANSGDELRRVRGWKLFLLLSAQDVSLSKAQREVDQS